MHTKYWFTRSIVNQIHLNYSDLTFAKLFLICVSLVIDIFDSGSSPKT